MRTIYKYELSLAQGDVQPITMPKGADILYVGTQPEVALHSVFVWAYVDTAAEPVTRTLAVTGTGHPAPDDVSRYLGSCQMQGFVWHVWDGGEE